MDPTVYKLVELDDKGKLLFNTNTWDLETFEIVYNRLYSKRGLQYEILEVQLPNDNSKFIALYKDEETKQNIISLLNAKRQRMLPWVRDNTKEESVVTRISDVLVHKFQSVRSREMQYFKQNEYDLHKLLQFIVSNAKLTNPQEMLQIASSRRFSKSIDYLATTFEMSSDNVLQLLAQHWNEIVSNPKTLEFMKQLMFLVKEFVTFDAEDIYKEYGYVSTLLYRDRPLMTITARVVHNHTTYTQVYIMRVISTYLYYLLVDRDFNTRNVSILLHSITAHTVKTKFPYLTQMKIPQPRFRMNQILKKAAEQYGFELLGTDFGRIISVEDGSRFLDIWRRWVPQDEAIEFKYCNACLKPTTLMCLETRVGYCNRKCQNRCVNEE